MLDPTTDPPPVRSAGPRVRVVWRQPDGTLQTDWPIGRIAEALADTKSTVWIDIEDRASHFSEVEALFRQVFRFHPLAIDDALQETHNPKLDDWDDYLYVVLHAIEFDPHDFEVQTQEIDLFLGPQYLISYHQAPIGLLDRLRTTIERDGGRRLEKGPDHLLYLLFDLLVSDYMPIIESLDDAIDAIQDEIFTDPDPQAIVRIMHLKRAATRLHRVLIPEREIANRLARDEFAQVDPRDRVYFRDVYDHLVRLHDISETLRDLIAGAVDTHLSAVSNRTNNVMKTLTIVSMLFLPLNFAVGFFGMNFFGDNIALGELGLSHTLLFALILVSMIGAPWVMWWYARRQQWF
jgi:magnesium transporter